MPRPCSRKADAPAHISPPRRGTGYRLELKPSPMEALRIEVTRRGGSAAELEVRRARRRVPSRDVPWPRMKLLVRDLSVHLADLPDGGPVDGVSRTLGSWHEADGGVTEGGLPAVVPRAVAITLVPQQRTPHSPRSGMRPRDRLTPCAARRSRPFRRMEERAASPTYDRQRASSGTLRRSSRYGPPVIAIRRHPLVLSANWRADAPDQRVGRVDPSRKRPAARRGARSGCSPRGLPSFTAARSKHGARFARRRLANRRAQLGGHARSRCRSLAARSYQSLVHRRLSVAAQGVDVVRFHDGPGPCVAVTSCNGVSGVDPEQSWP